jgi:hypothetical protein
VRTNPSFGSKADALRFLSELTGETPEQIQQDLKASIKRARAVTHPDRGIADSDKERRHELFVKVGHAQDAIEAFPISIEWEHPKREEPKQRRRPEPEPDWAQYERDYQNWKRARPQQEPPRPQASNSGTYSSGGGTYGPGKSTY